MKVILSRKGCDSDFGGMPGIIMPDDRIVYIPIPGDDFETIACHEVDAGNGLGNLCDVIRQVSPHMKMYGKKLEINEETKCHLDQDLDAGMYPGKSDMPYRGVLAGPVTVSIRERKGYHGILKSVDTVSFQGCAG